MRDPKKAIEGLREKEKHTAALRKLDVMAKDINARIKKADQYAGKSNDHYLAASIQLEAAKGVCEKAKINFKKWVAKNIKERAYKTVLNMIETIKDQKTIEGAGKAIEASRKVDAARKRKKRTSSRTPGTAATIPERSGTAATVPARAGTDATLATVTRTKFQIADEMLAGMTEKDQMSVAESRMGKLGFIVVDKTEYKKLVAGKSDGKIIATDPKVLMAGFLSLRASDMVQFVRKAADHIGFAVTDPFEGQHKDGDTGGIPASFKRTA